MKRLQREKIVQLQVFINVQIVAVHLIVALIHQAVTIVVHLLVTDILSNLVVELQLSTQLQHLTQQVIIGIQLMVR